MYICTLLNKAASIRIRMENIIYVLYIGKSCLFNNIYYIVSIGKNFLSLLELTLRSFYSLINSNVMTMRSKNVESESLLKFL